MRKILFLFFTAFAALSVLSCSTDDMPCINCDSSGKPESEYKGGSCKMETYATVVINGQEWMAENWGCYVKDSKCYGNSETNCKKYGRLYNWATAKTVCPTGWHLPDTTEWGALISYVESKSGCSNCAGELLKATDDWNANPQNGQPGNGSADAYDFKAIPGGGYYLNKYPNFLGAGDFGVWWSADEKASEVEVDGNSNGNSNSVSDSAYTLNITNLTDKILHESNNKKSLFSVRCLKDLPN